MDLSKLHIKPARRGRAIKPVDIFQASTLRGSIENLWAPQAEALAKWHDQRVASDIAIEMTTGGGKTLVGLLVAQSLVNETNGKVLYVCPTNQLLEQTRARAAECGIQVSTYHTGKWGNSEFYDQGTGPCLTNYDALFNGRSIFKLHDLQAIVFDDAHVAQNRIRSQYTLRFDHGSALYRPVAEFFRPYFNRNNQNQQFNDVIGRDSRALLYVPMFEVVQHAQLLQKKLSDGGIAKDQPFAWEYLKDKINRCTILISGEGIEISPYLLPVHDLGWFSGNVRRVYLTATVPSQSEFVRTFGVANPTIIKPGGKSGEAQRQFLFMHGESDAKHREAAKELIAPYKACIITPSERAAGEWSPSAVLFDTASGHQGVQQFREASDARKLVFAARYDGIDLPGNSCRILVLDGLPAGESLLDTFLERSLQIEVLRSQRTATRVIQALGRIFRSNNDHGAVVICGRAVRSWLSDPQKQAFLPRLLQQQVQFGIELSRLVTERAVTFSDLLKGVLSGTPDWDELYAKNVGSFDASEKPAVSTWMTELSQHERKAFQQAWNGNFGDAATSYGVLAEEAQRYDPRYAAWLRHLAGWASQLAGHDMPAARAYIQAANTRGELGRPPVKRGKVAVVSGRQLSGQAQRAAEIIFSTRRRVADRIDGISEGLVYGEPNVQIAEQALAELGELLGFESSRPDKTFGKGPDVLWLYPEEKAGVAFEAKTGKKSEGNYSKDDVGQVHNHRQWLDDTYPDFKVQIALVGRMLPVTDSASPSPDLRVIELEPFRGLLERYREMTSFINSSYQPTEGGSAVMRYFEEEGLSWPECVSGMQSTLAVDQQRHE